MSMVTGLVERVRRSWRRAASNRRIAAIRDEDIDTSDIPEADEDWFRQARWVEPDVARRRMTVFLQAAAHSGTFRGYRNRGRKR